MTNRTAEREEVSKPVERGEWVEPILKSSHVNANIANVIHQLTLIQREYAVERAGYEQTIRDLSTRIRELEAGAK